MTSRFGAAVKKARQARNMTLTFLAQEAGISKSLLSRIESGDRVDIRLSTATKLCKELGLSLDRIQGL